MIRGQIYKKKISTMKMMEWAKKLFPINRSITGEGLRKTICFIQKNINSNFKLKKARSNTKVFDWKIPKEWKINAAYIKDENDNKICDIKSNNLHLLGYSTKINKKMKLSELKKKINFIKNKPNSLPYYTSYYQKNWGFSLEYNKFKNLNKKKFYKVLVDSKHFKGEMNYTELLIKGKSKKEIMIMSYICHPSMANNELSGPLIIMALSKILKPQKYSVRLLLVPETIGAINFIKKNFKNLKKNLIAGFNLTCIGDKGPFTLISSKEENTYADKVAFRVLGKTKNFKKLSFLNRGSNERQFGCQNLNLPFVTICRTKFGDFKEYHTSDDNLKIINEKNLKKSLNMILKIIQEIQNNKIFIKKIYCEPFFTKYKLVRKIRGKQNSFERDISNITAYADKNSDLKDLAIKLNINSNKLNEKIKILQKHSILKEYI